MDMRPPTTADVFSETNSSTAATLSSWNDTKKPYPQEPFNKLITNALNKFEKKIAIRFRDQSLTYGELETKSNQFAHLLINTGIKPHDRVAVSVERSMEMVVALLGILKCGACYIPLDPAFPDERLLFMLEDSGATLLITSKASGSKLNANIKRILLEETDNQLQTYPSSDPDVDITSKAAAYILYTSGSTGKPKGVEILHYNLVNFLWSMQESPGINSDDKLLAITTISFDIAGLELYLPLISGAELHLADDQAVKDWRELRKLLENNITIMQATPSTWRMLIDSGWEGSKILKILCGGEPMTRKLADELLERSSSLWNMYGPTETTIWSTLTEVVPGEDVITIGRPIANTQIYILNDLLENVPVGEVGEICIGGDGVAAGYLNRPELTGEKFIEDPYGPVPGFKIYRTGDLGQYTPEGEILCSGRIDHQVKIRGFRIELGDIQHQLLKLPGIKDAVVVALESKSGNKYLCGYVQLMSINKATIKSEVINWKQILGKNLPDYMIPAEIVALESFPLTPNGKVDRNALPKPELQNEYSPPENELEESILKIWTETLGHDGIGTKDNFFELGGNSIIAVQVMTRIEKITGVDLSLATLFTYSTIKGLAEIVHSDQEAVKAVYNSLVPIKPGGSKVPLFVIHGGGLNVLFFNYIANELDPEQPVYGLQPKGLDGKEEPLDNIEHVAAHYIDQILTRRPTGPYLLAGYSMGGRIAFEMAKQLKAMGKEVKILAMLDTSAEISDWHVSLLDQMPRKFLQVFSKIKFHIIAFLTHPKHTFNYRKGNMLQSFNRSFKLGNEPEEPQVNKKINEAFEKAFHKYEMTPYDGEIYILKAKIPTYYRPDFKYLGWKPFARKGLKIYEVDGDHTSMLNPPNNLQVARVLQRCLDSVI